MEKEKKRFKPSEKVTVEKGKLIVGTDEDTGITVCEKVTRGGGVMGKVFRNVSTNGRVTVPSVVRNALEIRSGDILSFEITDGTVTVRKEKFDSKNAVQSFVEEYGSFSEKEQREILIELSLKWAKKETVNGGYQNVRK